MVVIRACSRLAASWPWLSRHWGLLFPGILILAFGHVVLVCGLSQRYINRPVDRATVRTASVSTPALHIPQPVFICPPSQQGELLDEVVVSNLVQCYVRARMNGDKAMADYYLGTLEARQATAVLVVRETMRTIKNERVRRHLQDALTRLES